MSDAWSEQNNLPEVLRYKARIAELEAEYRSLAVLHAEAEDDRNRLAARLAAVLASCDDMGPCPFVHKHPARRVYKGRAAAAGGTSA